MLSMLIFGFSYHEIVYKYRKGDSKDPTKKSKHNDGRIGWRKMPIRAQETLFRWEIDIDGGIQAMVQTDPSTGGTYIIPIEKSLLFRTSSQKNNPEGRSILRNAYRPWYFKRRIEEIEAIGIERDLAGLPVAYLPPEYLSSTASPEQVSVLNAIKEIVGSEAVNGTNKVNMSGITTKGNDIIIALKSPVNVMIPVLGQFMIMPKHVLADEDILKLDTNSFWRNPVVTGPYKVGTFSQGNFITLVPNDKFEGAKPNIKEINIIVSSNLVADAKSGKLDYFTSNDPDTIRAMSSVSTFKSAPLEVLFYRYLVVNPTGPFSNIKAREALKYGIDWNRLIPAIYGQQGKVIHGGVASGMPHYLPSIPKHKFDKAKATALLKEAKFDFSKTIRLRTYNQSQPAVMIIMTAVAQQLTELGMKVEFLPWTGDATTELWTNRNYELALKGLSAFNVSEWFGEYSNMATFGKLIGAQPEFAALSSQLLQATTLRQTGKILTDLQKLEQETMYKLPMHLLKQVVFISKNISGTPTKWGNPLYVYQNNIASGSAN
jgi:peptide/nickel transport system substrate-binding protein